MEQAKRNLVEKYLLVGITEEIGDFVAILEATVPRIFKGATKLFNEGAVSFMSFYTLGTRPVYANFWLQDKPLSSSARNSLRTRSVCHRLGWESTNHVTHSFPCSDVRDV